MEVITIKKAAINAYVPGLGVDDEFLMYHFASDEMRTPEFHSHDFYEIYFFIAGEASIYIEEYAFRLKTGDVVVFPPGRMHRAFFHETQAYYERMFIYISRETIRSMEQCGFALTEILDEHVARAHFHHSLSPEEFETCKYLFADVVNAADDPSPYQKAISRAKAQMLITHVCKWLGESPEKSVSRPAGRIANIIAYINEHLSEDLSLDQLSARFYVSKYHLIREFKSYTNCAVYQYILSKRIILSKSLLQDGVSPTDVFSRCGFHDYSSFYKAFRKETTLSPQQYLRSISTRAKAAIH